MEISDISIHTRQKKKGSVFYVQFKNDNGKWTNAKSTGIIDNGRKKDRDAAVKWAKDYLNSGQLITKENMLLDNYAENFFNWSGTWAEEKKLRGHRISEKHCEKNTDQYRLHIEPHLGGMKVSKINEDIINDWQLKLKHSGLSGSTINRVSTTLRILLKRAYKDKIIRNLPIVEAVSAKPKEKGIFTPEEIRTLFSKDWPDFRFQVANLLAACTGLRAGEIAALRADVVHEEYLNIDYSYDQRYGLHLPKSGKKRIVPIPGKVFEALQKLLEDNPHKIENPFVFYSIEPDKPNDPNTFNRALKTAIDDILEIDEEGRKKRGLTFHSWRHTFNSLLISHRVPLQSIQAVTGHLSDSMTELYYHVQNNDLVGIREIQQDIV